MGIRQFSETVLLPLLRARYSKCDWNFVGDPAGKIREDTDENTVFKELEDCGIDCEPANVKNNDPLVRWEAVRYFLQQLRDGKPGFQLHKRCKMMRKGFLGGYRLRRIQVVGSTRFHDKADKNKFSHPHDALQYAAIYARGDALYDNNEEFSRPQENRWSQ
jgi:hypothetical protein